MCVCVCVCVRKWVDWSPIRASFASIRVNNTKYKHTDYEEPLSTPKTFRFFLFFFFYRRVFSVHHCTKYVLASLAQRTPQYANEQRRNSSFNIDIAGLEMP